LLSRRGTRQDGTTLSLQSSGEHPATGPCCAEPDSPHDVHEGFVVETCSLNAEQREAVASLLTENVTVITGPPGTGKSQVATAAMANARLQDMPVLCASRNHKALD